MEMVIRVESGYKNGQCGDEYVYVEDSVCGVDEREREIVPKEFEEVVIEHEEQIEETIIESERVVQTYDVV